MFLNALTNTGATAETQSPENLRQLWSNIADMFEESTDPHQSMEGGQYSLIETITDLSKGKGHKITFPIGGRVYPRAKQGEERFTAATDYAKTPLGADDLAVDYVRFAHNESVRAAAHMGMVESEIFNRVPEMLGQTMGWWKSAHTQRCILHKINDENKIIAGNKTTTDALETHDTLSWDEVVDMNAALKPLGGKAALLGTDEQGNAIFGGAVVGTTMALTALKKDPVYKTNLQQAGPKAMSNKLFAGGVTMVDGNAFMEFVAHDHDDEGPIGCAYAPKLYLGAAITAGSASFTIKGGGSVAKAANTSVDYTWDFPKFAFKFTPADVLDTTTQFWPLNGSNNFYVTVINTRSNGAKWGIFEISANTGTGLTVAKRLAATTGGAAANTTVGDVTFNSSIHTEDFAVGSLCYLSTSRGLPLFATPMLLQRAIRRGYGMERNKRTEDTDEGGFGNYTYLRSVFGQNTRHDKDGRVPGVAVLLHTGVYEGWNIPTYTA
jgi:hypothetical protein